MFDAIMYTKVYNVVLYCTTVLNYRHVLRLLIGALNPVLMLTLMLSFQFEYGEGNLYYSQWIF